MFTLSKRGNQAVSLKKKIHNLFAGKKKCWLSVPSGAQSTPSASRSVLTPCINKLMVSEGAEPPSRSGTLTFKSEVHRYGNTVGDALMQEMYFLYSLMHNAQFILSTTFLIH